MHHLVIHAGSRAERRAPRRRNDALEQLDNRGHLRMSNVVVDLGSLRDDVGRIAALGDHVVDAGVRRHVLAHEIDHEVHGLHAVER